MIDGHLGLRVSGLIVQSMMHWLALPQRISSEEQTDERASLHSTWHLPVPHLTSMPLHDSWPSQTTVTSRASDASSCISRHAESAPQLMTASAPPATNTPFLVHDSSALQFIVRFDAVLARTIDESQALGAVQSTVHALFAWHCSTDSRHTSSSRWHLRLQASAPVHGPHCGFAFELHCSVVESAGPAKSERLSVTASML